ncbi:MAG: hypothetical protein R6U39_02910 [Candidatus Aegiribacteria sp.]
MKIKEFVRGFLTVFPVTLGVTVVVTLLWNLVFHGSAGVDWATAFRFAIIFGVILPWVQSGKRHDR